ncbi:MAG: aminotransferase class III-fold pyridoxal phosphate-dependent enzyme [Bdellovibrionales bacterium]|nr:aminotransferase class III-fold pyridoxal phosphate-dependent enzyme [Bdellovibrionales bacterium]
MSSVVKVNFHEPEWSSAEIFAREMRLSSGSYRKRELALVRGEREFVFDVEGRRYLDCITGIGTSILGHAHPRLVKAISHQASQLLSAPELLCNPVRAQYQEQLLEALPPGYNRVFLCNSGTEANEAALKFSRLASQKTRFVSLELGYHGKTLGSLSVTANAKYREPFEPLIPGVFRVRLGDKESLREAFAEEETAAFIFEAIQGEGGVHMLDRSALEDAVSCAKQSGAYVICDEVQCGFGRTGKMFGYQHFDVEPDFITMAKAIAGGVPMGAVAIHERVPEIPAMSHTSTFGGNPLACAAASAVLSTIQEEHLIEHAQDLGARFREGLFAHRPRQLREIRGQGLMIGLELKRRALEPLQALQGRGVLALLAGNRVLRFLPPLIISQDSLDFLLEQVTEVLQ